MRQKLWVNVSGKYSRIAENSNALTAAETTLIAAWNANADKAARELHLLVSEEQKVYHR